MSAPAAFIPAWKFYREENKRHSWADSVSIQLDREAAEEAVARLARRLRLGPVAVYWLRKGSHMSWAWRDPVAIEFAHTANWLVLAHEVAHLWQYARTGESDHNEDLAEKVSHVVAVLYGWGYVSDSAARQADLYTLRDLAQRFTCLRFSCPAPLRSTLTPVKAARERRGGSVRVQVQKGRTRVRD